MKQKLSLVSLFVLIALFISTISASAWSGHPQDPAPQAPMDEGFTYQGYLTDSNGTPVYDICDMRFSLFTAETGGTLIGSQELINIQVDHGYFSVRLNQDAEFGDPFNGMALYLQIEVGCDNGGPAETLWPRQLLTAAPYATYALNIPNHNHNLETWSVSSANPVLTLENSMAPGRTALKVISNGIALEADGKIYSNADSTLYLSPYTAMSRATPSEFVMYYTGVGSASLDYTNNTVKERLLVFPISAYGQIFGMPQYIKSLEVCYKADTTGPQFIDGTGIYKGNQDSSSYEAYLSSTTDYSSTTRECYTITASTPRKAIDNSSFVQIHLNADGPISATDGFTIYSVKLTLTENQN